MNSSAAPKISKETVSISQISRDFPTVVEKALKVKQGLIVLNKSKVVGYFFLPEHFEQEET